MRLGAIAESIGISLTGGGEGLDIQKPASLGNAGPSDISFAANEAAAHSVQSSKACALVLPVGVVPDRPSFVVKNPALVFARIAAILSPEPAPAPGIHPTAVVGEGVAFGVNVHVGASVTVGARCVIGDNVSIRDGARVMEDCQIGANTVIFENVVVYRGTRIGERCRIHANTTIGSDGFGYVRDSDGTHVKIPQLGRVVIEDDVEIGANTSIDRATLDETRIGSGTKIDNQVQIGHNCKVGKNVVIAGLSGLAGSVTLEDGVMIGGAAAVADHVRICSGALIAGKTGVYSDITEPGVYAGPMAMKNMEYKRFLLSGKRMDRLEKKISELKKEIEE
ncbi:MAG: UDP-3-O-(3-hydroxymyristoyl)glucosamine N-acyltransferase [Nitrospinae bacterium]|nr:UDP-3-O-(3-hydroxymyristoyl)glucosamine N-acyltransferase [Nitrospinota bacterium]MBF0635483.1 UDP-3-O-(3-hydroxymyristoyl)glucosamine N-acyltransferase [Nitrospinota bacterium]